MEPSDGGRDGAKHARHRALLTTNPRLVIDCYRPSPSTRNQPFRRPATKTGHLPSTSEPSCTPHCSATGLGMRTAKPVAHLQIFDFAPMDSLLLYLRNISFPVV